MSYTVREVSAMLGLSASQIRGYAARGFLAPERGSRGELRFGFQDLVILRTAAELTAAHVPQRKIKRVLEQVRGDLPEGQSLTGLRIAADGERVSVRDGATIWNPESGQKLFDFSIADIAETTRTFALHAAPPKSDEQDADALFELGCELESADPAGARHAYQGALRLDPRHVEAHINLGRMLHEDGHPADAEKHYQSALAIDPEHALAAFNLGVALEDLGRLADAVSAYETALGLDPDNADAHYNLAGIYERRGDKQGALRHLKEYRKLG